MQLENVVIQSARLLLKPLSADYAEAIFAEFHEPVTLYMFPRPPAQIGETLAFIAGASERLKAGTDLELLILTKENNEFIGCAGVHDIQTREPAFGIWLKQSAQGLGYGKETIVALKQWVDENLNFDYIRYPVVEENIFSRRIPESLGATIEKQYTQTMLTGRTYNVLEYHIT